MLIELAGIYKRYRTDEVETTALHDVSLTVAAGEFVSIMGPSGGGKSTLMNVLGLIDRADAGSYRFAGEDVSSLPQRRLTDLRKDNIGFVFQGFNLIHELSVFDNVELPLLYDRQQGHWRSGGARRKAVAAVLERVDMAHRHKHLPRQLSGGQQQRVAVARAIVNRPRLILADEPTGNLDTRHGDEVMALLGGLRDEGTTVVMVTHSPDTARCGDRIVRMVDGMILPDPVEQNVHA